VRIIIAGGGTGGHLFPGVAIAEEFLGRGQNNEILFLGTEWGLEKKLLPGLGFTLRTLDLAGIKGKGVLKSFSALLKIPAGMLESRKIMKDFRPDVVIGVGGYASGPAVLTAHLMSIKTAIAEQNALPGATNRFLGKLADRIFVAFPETNKWFAGGPVMVTGNPVRAAFLSSVTAVARIKGKFTLLVFGGSQGAHRINMVVLEALEKLESMKNRLRIIHQTGRDDFEEISKRYSESGLESTVLPFIDDMATVYRSADLLICRAGATTIAEITASGKAAILVPFPFAVNDHQTKNARILVNRGAAEMIPERELTGEHLAGIIARLFNNPEKIREMEERSAALGNIHAARDIVDACIALAGSQDPDKRFLKT
jgi:UDP-N-acetylglucosamine--N-acetylmuramyl-(pentapeptide) pyrophosphoryl-undecaprenol N-acetylglucosamine transferase